MPSTTEDDKSNDYTIAAVDRAIALLEILGRIGPASLAELAKQANCTRTGTFRLLRTMRSRDFVVQDGPRGSWRLGARIQTLRQSAAEQGAMAASAAPRLLRLAQDSGEVAYLLERIGLEAVVAAIHQADPAAFRYGAVGTRWPLHAGGGRLLLAMAPEVVQTQLLAKPLPRMTPLTITDPRKVSAELARVRERGWLVTESESETGVISISAPVRDSGGNVSASVMIVGSAVRLRGKRTRELLPPVIEAATDISRMLGWNDRRAPAPAAPPHPDRPRRM